MSFVRRLLPLVVVLLNTAIMLLCSTPEDQMAKAAGIELLALAAIYLGPFLDGYTGPAGHGYVNTPTPGVAIVIGGWLILVLGPLVYIGLMNSVNL